MSGAGNSELTRLSHCSQGCSRRFRDVNKHVYLSGEWEALEFPGGPVVRSGLSLLRAWVQSLITGLRSHKLHSETKINASVLLGVAGEVLPADIRAELLEGEKETLRQWAERRSCMAGLVWGWKGRLCSENGERWKYLMLECWQEGWARNLERWVRWGWRAWGSGGSKLTKQQSQQQQPGEEEVCKHRSDFCKHDVTAVVNILIIILF